MSASSIFIVSVDTPFADGLAQSLRDLGFSIAGVAADLLADAMPDAVILDLAPGADARQSIADLREKLPAPLVVLTSAPFAEVPTAAGSTVGYLRKPFEERDLKLALEVELFRNGDWSPAPPVPAPVAPVKESAAPVVLGDSRLLGVLAMDVRYPVGSVLGYSRFVQNHYGEDMPEEALKLVQTIEQLSGAMLAQVDALVDLSTIASSELSMVMGPIDLKALVRRMAEVHREVGEEQDVDIELDLTSFPCMIQGDLHKMSQVLTILITNAIQSSEARSKVVVAIRYRGGEIEVAVKDEGAGVPLEEQDRVFNPTGRKPPGPALVLAIARKLVEAHGGRIGIESALGSGSTLWFTVPMVSAKA